MYAHVYVCLSISQSMHVSVQVCVFLHVCLYMCLFVCVHLPLCVCLFGCVSASEKFLQIMDGIMLTGYKIFRIHLHECSIYSINSLCSLEL